MTKGSSETRQTTDSAELISSPIQKPKRKKMNRFGNCFHCSRRLKITETGFICRCQKAFCSKHRHSDQHNCQYDHAQHEKRLLQKQLTKCVASKTENI